MITPTDKRTFNIKVWGNTTAEVGRFNNLGPLKYCFWHIHHRWDAALPRLAWGCISTLENVSAASQGCSALPVTPCTKEMRGWYWTSQNPRPSAAAVQGLYSASLERRRSPPSLKTAEYTGFPFACFRFRLFTEQPGFSCTWETRGSQRGLRHTVSYCVTLTCCYPGKGRVKLR